MSKYILDSATQRDVSMVIFSNKRKFMANGGYSSWNGWAGPGTALWRGCCSQILSTSLKPNIWPHLDVHSHEIQHFWPRSLITAHLHQADGPDHQVPTQALSSTHTNEGAAVLPPTPTRGSKTGAPNEGAAVLPPTHPRGSRTGAPHSLSWANKRSWQGPR